MMNGGRWKIGLTLVFALIALANSNPAKAAGKTVIHTKQVKNSGGSSNNKERGRRSLDVGEAVALTGAPRLPTSVTPLGYKLNLIPDLEEAKFRGHIQINLTCHSETDTVTLHAHDDLHISHSDVTLRQILEPHSNDSTMKINHPLNYRGSGPFVFSSGTAAVATIVVAGTKREPDNEWYVITLGENLKVGALYQLNLDFSGTLDQVNSEGFFRGSYVCHRTKERKWFAGTRMRPNKARKIFPCFDEPAFKVPFEISIARKKQDNTISNMALRATEPMSGDRALVWDHYMTSPPMSTVSVGIFVSDFEFVTPVDNGKYTVPVRVYGQSQMLSELEATANLVPMVIEQIEEYLATGFPLTKVDLVAVPHYNAPDPADHWGLVLFKESDLIGDFSHWRVNTEMVYQWLGHLTTPQWWDESLINRALSTFIVSGLKSNGMKEDYWGSFVGYSLYYQYSMRNPYANLATQEFSIRSSKAMWLLRMLNYTMTGPVFRRGLQNFFQNRKFHTFTECDLWAALQEVTPEGSDVTVEDVARSWMTSDHFPVVTVTRDYDNNTAVAEQHTFLRERPHNLPGKENMTWYVPIMFLSADNMDLGSIRPVAWLKGEKEITIDNLPASDKFIVVNPEEIGMFMVNYDPANWALLAEALVQDPEQFTVETRSKLLHDAWNLGYGGELSLATVLDMTRFLPRERQFTVWDTAFTMLDHLGRHTGGTVVGRKFTSYMGKLIADLLRALQSPSPEQDPTFVKLKETAKYVLSGVSREQYQEASTEFGQWMESEDPDEGNPVKDKCFCTVFKWGTTEEWEFGLDRVVNFPASRVQSERSYILKTLAGCPNESYKVERILNVTILEGNGNFSDADIGLVLSMLTGSHTGYNTLFRFLVQNWDTIKQRFDSKPYMWINIVDSATGLFKTQEGLDMVSELYVARQGEFGAAEPVMERSLKVIKEEARWSDDNLPIMEAWLDQEGNEDQVTSMA